MSEMIAAGLDVTRSFARPANSRPLEQAARALVINPSVLDISDYALPIMTDLGFDVITLAQMGSLTEKDRLATLAGVEVIIGPGPHLASLVASAPKLRVISLASSGFESLDLDDATARGIAVTNAPTDDGTEAVADLTFGLMLDVSRKISASNRDLRAGVWRRPMGVTLWQKTLGIVGLGKIGSAVARRALGFDMTVLAAARTAASAACAEPGVRCVPLPDLLRQSDVVSLHCRYSERTHHLIGHAELQMMRATAFLVNTSRPGVVDQQALLEALRTNRIAGAGLDVYDGEPAADDPIIGLPNTVVTPHIGNRTHEGVRSVAWQSIANAVAVLHGEQPAFLLNPQLYERGA